jgi:acyl-CoA thioesterase
VAVDPLLPLDVLLHSSAGTLAVPETWNQGRGAFGGFVTGAMVHALEASAPDRPLRSLTAELCGPLVAGDAAVELSVLRAGNAVTTTAIRFVQHGEVQAHGVGVLGKQRMRDRDQVVERAPGLTPWRDVPVAVIDPSFGPSFAQHFEMRIVRGLPFAGGVEPIVEGWVQPKRAGTARDAAYLAACIDCYYPCLFAIEKVPRPMATIAFTFQPFEFSGDPDAPLAYRARMLASESGYCVEFRELWTAEGRLVALNQQTMVIIK